MRASARSPGAHTMEDDKAQTSRNRFSSFFWRCFLAVDIPLLLAVAFAIAAPHLHPRPFWWAQLLAVFLPYLVIPTVVAAIVSILWKKWIWVGLHVALLLLIGLRAFPVERFSAPQIEGADDLVILTFNAPRYGPSEEALGDSMIALVREFEPDMIALQEAWITGAEPGQPGMRAPQVRALTDSLAYTVATPPRMSSQAAWSSNSTSVPMLFRQGVGEIEVVEQSAVQLSDTPDDHVSVAIRTRFRWHGREAVIYNIHLRSFGVNKPWEDRIHLTQPQTWLPYLRQYRMAYRQRAAEAEALAEHIEDETLPVILAGDFNGTVNNWTVRKLKGQRSDAFQVAGAGPGHTYRADKPFVRIDFLFADADWTVIGAHVPNVQFSDHRPLVVRLRWRDEGPAE